MSIKVKQHDIRDCGAACLASIAAFHKLHIPIAKIRQYASTDKRGTNVLGIIQAAERMGFIAKGVKGGMDALPNIPKPAIAHLVIGEKQLHHFVVIYKVTKTGVTVMDPGSGKMATYSLDEFGKIWTGVLVLLVPGEEFKVSNEKISVYKRFWNLIKPHRTVLIQALFGAIIYTILGLSTSIYIEKITDNVLPNGNRNLLNLLGVIMVVILLMQIFININKSTMVMRSGQLMDANLILGYYKHILNLPQRFFDTMRTGEIISRVNDAVKIRTFINDVAINFIVNVFIVIFSFALMFSYYWKLALIIAIIIPLYLIVYFLINYFNKKVERRLMEDSADLESQLVESLGAVKTIKQFGIEDFANEKTENKFIRLLYTIFRSGQNAIFAGNSSEFLSRIFTIILLWVGSGYVIDQEITPGELLSFYALIGYFTSPITQLVGMNKTIQNALIAADRLFEIMDLEREETTEKTELKKEMIGDIAFKNVSFSYGTRIDVFKDFEIIFPKGKVSAVVGESGSGKTTLISLIQNLYPLKSGNIQIGNFDIKYLTTKSLRDLVAIVPQQVDLFSGNIIDNIALGDNQPNIQRIIELSQQLGIIEFVEKLPNGFETYLGENGAMLSGGQRQRIAIARALYKSPEILILDEATSSLDTNSEGFVQKTLHLLKEQNKTIIIIAHRLSTVIFSDSIFVLEKGKLVEQGNHQQLISENGKYADLFKKQNISIL